MSLLKRIGGTGPMPNGQEGINGSGPLPNQPAPTGTNPGTASPSSVLPRATGRLAAPPEQNRGVQTSGDNFLDLKNRVQHKLIAELDPKLDLTRTDEVRRQVEEIFNEILDAEN